MNETDKTSEILDSLDKFVEKQKHILEEENQLLLEKGKKEFEEIIAERKKHPDKSNILEQSPNNSWKLKVNQLSQFFAKIKKYLSKLFRKIRLIFHRIKSKSPK